MHLLKVFYLIIIFICISCAKRNTSSVVSSLNEKQSNARYDQNYTTSTSDSIYLEDDKLVLIINDKVQKYDGLVINAMALTTSLEVIDKNSFYLIYEYSASATKMKEIYKYIYNNGLFLVYKETIKHFGEESGAKRMYLKNFKITEPDFEILESLGGTIEVPYQENSKNDLTRLYNHNEQVMGDLHFNISGLNRFIESPLLGKNKENITEKMTITNIVMLNNTAFFLQQVGDHKETVFILEKIINQYPNRMVAHLNLADSYWELNKIDLAKKAYQKYIQLMSENDKEDRIPKRVSSRLNN